MTNAVIPSQWMNWIEENRSRGVAEADILDIMVSNGFDPRIARNHVARAASRPYSSGAEEEANKLGKLQCLMNIYSELLSHCRGVEGIDRVTEISSEQFFRWYYAANRPVILRQMMSNWDALDRWTPDYLKWRYGGEIVEVMTGRNSDARYEINCELHKTSMRMDEYVDLVERTGETNDFYMVANNRSNGAGALRSLLDEVDSFDGILDSRNTADKLFFWFGPAGTVTPLHHDTMNILLAQVLGRKKITLIPSFQTHLVYNDVGVYSEVDCEAPDYERYPLFRNVSRFEVVLEPGEVLFIPVGWWHHVRSLDVSISVSFTNFLVPNSYAWDEAG